MNRVCQVARPMLPMLKSSRIHFILATGICSLFLGGSARSQEAKPAIIPRVKPAITTDTPPAIIPDAPPILSQDAPPEKARALLDQVKKSEQDRQVAVKQTEIDRLKEDQAKIDGDSTGLKKTIESTTGLTNDATERLSALTLESRRLEHELAVAEARSNAEKLKIEGLRALADAQGKSLSALALRAEEAAARSSLRTVELEILQAGKQIPGEGHEPESQTELTKARNALAAAESKAQAEERLAHDAMKAAAARMVLAETSATTAQRLADNDLTLEAPVAKAKPKAKSPEKPAEKPAAVAAGPNSAPTAGTPSKPSTSVLATILSKKPTSAPAARR